jgi:1,4-dihydroxy-2-naphthoate polyprenyltransferase
VLYAIGILAIGAAYSYTASKKPYGYRGWGDLAVFIFFGLVGVAGSHYLLTGSFSFDILLPSAWMGLQSCAVLNLNNLRDHESDARSGKHTLVVQWGYDAGKRYHAVLIFTPVVLMLVWFARIGEAVGYAMPAIWLMVSWVHYRRVRRTREARALDPELKFIALSSFLCALLFFILAEV